MINLLPIPIQTESGEYMVYVSPVLLQPTDRPKFQSGKVGRLYIYKELRDDEYKSTVDPADLSLLRNPENIVIYYGQDFSKYYLGSFNIDFEHKRYWDWEGNTEQLTTQHIKALASYLFDPPSNQLPQVVLFTPTRPSDINLSVIRKPQ